MKRDIEKEVRSRYGAIAAGGAGADPAARAVAQAFGYSPEELNSVPEGANLGLSCGNPTAFAGLRHGETVVDLGCGGGIDVFLAAGKVGPSGKAIGIDMTPEMIDLAKRNALKGPGGKPYGNVEFHLARIDALPLKSDSVDCVISNCVINLAEDKRAVFREIARVLKPGGRLAVSDIALKKELPPEIAGDLAAHVGCISGAIGIAEYEKALAVAGFSLVRVIDGGADLNAYVRGVEPSCCASSPAAESEQQAGSCRCSAGEPEQEASCGCGARGAAEDQGDFRTGLAEVLSRFDVNEYAASVKVFAVKPSGT
jgi:arsenite methyltransferase